MQERLTTNAAVAVAVVLNGLHGEMGALEARMTTAMATQARYDTATMVGAVLTTGALAFAAAGLT